MLFLCGVVFCGFIACSIIGVFQALFMSPRVGGETELNGRYGYGGKWK